MIRKLNNNLFNLLLLTSLFTACWQRRHAFSAEEMQGTYVFVYPSGETEVLVISADSSYRKDIYEHYDGFKSKLKPKYMNEGKFSIETEGELIFYDWLMYCDRLDPTRIRAEPLKTIKKNNAWRRPTNTQKAKISVYGETGYIFEKN